MLSAPLYDLTGKKIGQTKLSPDIFGAKVNLNLLTQAVRVYQFRQRQGTKKAKTRGEIAKTTQKVWRQKGTGRARHGSRRAPIFVGGGVAHGPTGIENYNLKLTRRMRRQALISALSDHAAQGHVLALEDLTKFDGKTQTLNLLLTSLKLIPGSGKILLILDQPLPPVIQAGRNLKTLSVTQSKRLNVYEVLAHSHLIFSQAALKTL